MEETTLTPINIDLSVRGQKMELRYQLDGTQMSQMNIIANIRNGQMYERFLSDLLMRLLHPGDTFLDIGAHVGFFSVMAAHLCGPKGRVVSIEPNADNFAHLNRHVALNELDTVETVNAVVCETDGTVEFYKNADNDGGHALWDPGLHEFNKVSRKTPEKDVYPSVRIDTLAEKHGLKGAKAVKIDTEGAELMVLKSGENFFRPDRVPFIVCEFNSFALEAMGTSQDELRRYMKSRGYMTFLFADKSGLPVLLPDATALESGYVFNVIFSTLDAVGAAWPIVQPLLD